MTTPTPSLSQTSRSDREGTSRRIAAGPIVIRACQNLCDCQNLLSLYQRCESILQSGIDRMKLDLSTVEQADSKLVACLVDLIRTAGRLRVAIEVTTSVVVRQWLSVCRLEGVLGTA